MKGEQGDAGSFSGRKTDFELRPHLQVDQGPEEYVVQFGDTLFDICEQLLGDGSFWPKLWSINPYIKNPHFIWPGMRLNFYPGDDEMPPYLQVIKEDDILPIDTNHKILSEVLEIPSASKLVASVNIDWSGDSSKIEDLMHTKRVGKLMLESSRTMNYKTEVIGIGEIKSGSKILRTIGNLYSNSYLSLTLPGVFKEDKLSPLATVHSSRSGKLTMGEGEVIFCKVEENLKPQIYTIVRPIEDVAFSYDGYLYNYVGVVKLEKFSNDGDFISGAILSNQLDVAANDLIIPYENTKAEILFPDIEDAKNLEPIAEIVAFSSEGRTIGGEGDYVYINGGKNMGYKKGQVLQISHPLNEAYDMIEAVEDLPEDFSAVGVVTIIEANMEGSIGYIFHSLQEVNVGDMISKG